MAQHVAGAPSPKGDGPYLHWKRNFYTIAAGQAFSLIGSSAAQFALIWWLASETDSPMVLSIAGLVAFLPQLLLGPFAGVWIDRMKRKWVIMGADLFIGAVAAVFALLFLAGTPPYWAAYVVLGLRAVGELFHRPAIQAAVPMLVPPEQLVRVNGVNQFLQSGSFMLGPVLGAALYAAFPLPIIMLSDVVGAIAASATVAATPIPDPPKQAHQIPHFFQEMKEGAKVFLRDRPLCVITLAATFSMLFYLPLSSLYPLMTTALSGTAWHASIIELAYAGGMMLCAGLVSIRGEIKSQFRTIHLALFGLGLTSLLCGILPLHLSWFWAFALLCMGMGASGNLYNIPYMAYLQRTIPQEAQGRAFSLISSLMSFAMPLGLLMAGPAAQAEGVAYWFLVSGIAIIAITAISAIIVARLNKQECDENRSE